MTSFSSQLGTKTATGALEPFGWTRKDRHFHDARAEQAHQRAVETGVHFGRREVVPPKQYRLLKRGEESPSAHTLIAQPQVQRFEIRHPHAKLTRAR